MNFWSKSRHRDGIREGDDAPEKGCASMKGADGNSGADGKIAEDIRMKGEAWKYTP